jgi:hypothetical protein
MQGNYLTLHGLIESTAVAATNFQEWIVNTMGNTELGKLVREQTTHPAATDNSHLELGHCNFLSKQREGESSEAIVDHSIGVTALGIGKANILIGKIIEVHMIDAAARGGDESNGSAIEQGAVDASDRPYQQGLGIDEVGVADFSTGN